ncbi:MAG TPA: TPM domain-containing protein [Verrucomicrobiae bacterium]|nr:TPM domain-containing protein [Verrucomicrobiae bacterium]
MFRNWCIGLWIALVISVTRAAETIPPVPTRYFNDYAGAVSTATAQELNSRLEQFEKDSSSQIVVVVYPKM